MPNPDAAAAQALAEIERPAMDQRTPKTDGSFRTVSDAATPLVAQVTRREHEARLEDMIDNEDQAYDFSDLDYAALNWVLRRVHVLESEMHRARSLGKVCKHPDEVK